MRTIDKIITKCDCKFGAPMGRPDAQPEPIMVNGTLMIEVGNYFDCRVPMCADNCYDKGGAYWGVGKELRVSYTKDLSYIHFYRRK